MMLLNIKTGYNGVPKVASEEIVIIVSSLRKVAELNISFVFSDQHAYLAWADFYTDLASLDRVDWHILQNRDFKRDDNDLGKTDRYQAEALVWKHLPVEGILGVCRFTDDVRRGCSDQATGLGLSLQTLAKPEWYYL